MRSTAPFGCLALSYNLPMFVMGHGVSASSLSPNRFTGLIVACFCVAIFLLGGCAKAGDSGTVQHTRDAEQPDVVSISTTAAPQQQEQQAATPELILPSVPEAGSETTGYPAANTPGPIASAPGCVERYFFEPAPSTCPSSPSQSSAAAEQPFEQGFMIWLEATDSIYVFSWDGTWQRFEDLFLEGQEEFNPDIIPPAGMYQPVRGFGKVWRSQPKVREQLGWALSRELGYESAFQSQQVEGTNPAVLFLRAFNGQVLALTHRELSEGDWVVAASH